MTEEGQHWLGDGKATEIIAELPAEDVLADRILTADNPRFASAAAMVRVLLSPLPVKLGHDRAAAVSAAEESGEGILVADGSRPRTAAESLLRPLEFVRGNHRLVGAGVAAT